MTRFTTTLLTRAAAAGTLLACVVPTALASASPTSHATSAKQAMDVRLLAQQGLAIGEASNVLQANLRMVAAYLLSSETKNPYACEALAGGGAVRLISAKQVSTTAADVVVRMYFDPKCAHTYIAQKARLTQPNDDTIAADETWTYYAPSGRKLGVFTAKASVTTGDSSTSLGGAGTFTPVGKHPAVSLGLTCSGKDPSTATAPQILQCAGGIAQPFPALHMYLGSITPLKLTIAQTRSGPGKVSFAGSSGRLSKSAKKLTVTRSKANVLALAGTPTRVGTAVTSGSAATFALFTPRPTGWTVSDPATHTRFSIAVRDAAKNLAGSVVDTRTGKKYATFALDLSGTGTIRYAGAKAATPVTSWTLAG